MTYAQIVLGDAVVAEPIVAQMTEYQREAVRAAWPSSNGLVLTEKYEHDAALEVELIEFGLANPCRNIAGYFVPPTLTTTGLKVHRHLIRTT
jgi:hypothetical protein